MLTSYIKNTATTLLFIGASFIGGTALAQDKYELSMESAILYALENNPDIEIAREQYNQQTFETQRAKSVFYPQVDANILYGPEYNNPAALNANQVLTSNKSETTPSTDANLTINQFIYDGLSSQNEYKRQQQLTQSATINKKIVVNDILSETIESYLSVYIFQTLRQKADEFVTNMAEIYDLVTLQTEAGAENYAKKNYVESRLSNARSQLENIQSSYKNSISRLEFLIGETVPFEVYQPDILELANKELQAYIRQALNQNNALRLQDSDIRSVEYATRREEGTLYPTVNFITELATTNDVGGNVGSKQFAAAQIQLSYKIFDGFARQAAIGQQKSRKAELEHEKRREEKLIKQETELYYNRIIAIQNDLEITDQEIKASEDLQKLSQQQFELGEGDLITLVEGEERLYAAIAKKVELQSQLINTTYQLMRVTGMLDKSIFCASC